MSHKGIRFLIENTAKSLGDDIQFTYARKSDFDVMRDKRYPFISLDPLRATPTYAVNNTQNYVKTWIAEMAFYELDNMDSIGDDYAKILDDVDVLVDSFIQKLNFFSGNHDIILTSFSQEPFIKATADILTGYTLTLQIQVPDNWDYCADGC